MKDRRDDFYYDSEEKNMLASNLAASLNIPPDITITAVSVPVKSITPPPKPGLQNNHMNFSSNNNQNNSVNLNRSNHYSSGNLNLNSHTSSVALNLSSRNSPLNLNNQNIPLNLITNQNSPINLNLNCQNDVMNLENQNNAMNLSSPNQINQNVASVNSPGTLNLANPGPSKYSQLLDVIEEIGKDIRPTYSGSKSSAERLRRSIGLARILIRQCLMETEPNIKQ